MKALLITYHFPPMLGCCALRTGAVAHSLAEKGWECHIVTAAIQDEHPIYTIDAETKRAEPLCHVYPISEGRTGRLVQRLRGGDPRPKPSSDIMVSLSVGSRPSRVNQLLRAMAFPDSKVSWMPGAYARVMRLLRRHRFDLIYSFGYPWSCHVIGYAAQRRAEIPWVADYADPWTLNPDMHWFPQWRKRLDFWLESRLLRRTSAVVVATPEAQAFLERVFGQAVRARSYVARVAQFPSNEYVSLPGHLPDHFQIGFTGLLDPTRQPYSFFDAARVLAGQDNVRICMAGLIGESFKNYARELGLNSLIHYPGRLGRQQTIDLQQTSHLLVSFGWPGGLQVPCKIYEYFAARRPILHIEGDAQDPAATLIRQRQRGLVVSNNQSAISGALRLLYQYWASGKLEGQFDLSPLSEFHLPQSLGGIEQAFDEAILRERLNGEAQVSERLAEFQSKT